MALQFLKTGPEGAGPDKWREAVQIPREKHSSSFAKRDRCVRHEFVLESLDAHNLTLKDGPVPGKEASPSGPLSFLCRVRNRARSH